jgi:hypothetical protein
MTPSRGMFGLLLPRPRIGARTHGWSGASKDLL